MSAHAETAARLERLRGFLEADPKNATLLAESADAAAAGVLGLLYRVEGVAGCDRRRDRNGRRSRRAIHVFELDQGVGLPGKQLEA